MKPCGYSEEEQSWPWKEDVQRVLSCKRAQRTQEHHGRRKCGNGERAKG